MKIAILLLALAAACVAQAQPSFDGQFDMPSISDMPVEPLLGDPTEEPLIDIPPTPEELPFEPSEEPPTDEDLAVEPTEDSHGPHHGHGRIGRPRRPGQGQKPSRRGPGSQSAGRGPRRGPGSQSPGSRRGPGSQMQGRRRGPKGRGGPLQRRMTQNFNQRLPFRMRMLLQQRITKQMRVMRAKMAEKARRARAKMAKKAQAKKEKRQEKVDEAKEFLARCANVTCDQLDQACPKVVHFSDECCPRCEEFGAEEACSSTDCQDDEQCTVRDGVAICCTAMPKHPLDLIEERLERQEERNATRSERNPRRRRPMNPRRQQQQGGQRRPGGRQGGPRRGGQSSRDGARPQRFFPLGRQQERQGARRMQQGRQRLMNLRSRIQMSPLNERPRRQPSRPNADDACTNATCHEGETCHARLGVAICCGHAEEEEHEVANATTVADTANTVLGFCRLPFSPVYASPMRKQGCHCFTSRKMVNRRNEMLEEEEEEEEEEEMPTEMTTDMIMEMPSEMPTDFPEMPSEDPINMPGPDETGQSTGTDIGDFTPTEDPFTFPQESIIEEPKPDEEEGKDKDQSTGRFARAAPQFGPRRGPRRFGNMQNRQRPNRPGPNRLRPNMGRRRPTEEAEDEHPTEEDGHMEESQHQHGRRQQRPSGPTDRRRPRLGFQSRNGPMSRPRQGARRPPMNLLRNNRGKASPRGLRRKMKQSGGTEFIIQQRCFCPSMEKSRKVPLHQQECHPAMVP